MGMIGVLLPGLQVSAARGGGVHGPRVGAGRVRQGLILPSALTAPDGPKTIKSREQPRTCPLFGVQTRAWLRPPPPPNPVALAWCALWDEAELKSEASIMSYDPFFVGFRVFKFTNK